MTKILLYSGGLDSYIAWRMLDYARGGEWTPVYLALTGSRYREKEMGMMPFPKDRLLIRTVAFGMEHGLEREDAYIPQRNTLLVTLAQAHFDADEVALCAVDGEYSRDKHASFFNKVSDLLSYTAGKPVHVFSPLVGSTKAQAVSNALAIGVTPEELIATVSCYDPVSRACGACMSCFRRWVALEANSIAWDGYDQKPWEWISKGHSSTGNLLRLPPSEWLKFGRAQADVLVAYFNLVRRRALTKKPQ